jgi:hypothetical protein
MQFTGKSKIRMENLCQVLVNSIELSNWSIGQSGDMWARDWSQLHVLQDKIFQPDFSG